VELGPTLAQRAREHLADLRHAHVLVGSFEGIELPVDQFDLVFSATAFHWVDPSVGFQRAASILKPSGTLALATSAHVAGGTRVEILDSVAALQVCTYEWTATHASESYVDMLATQSPYIRLEPARRSRLSTVSPRSSRAASTAPRPSRIWPSPRVAGARHECRLQQLRDAIGASTRHDWK
jgi:SAM-dependent methyltransferase